MNYSVFLKKSAFIALALLFWNTTNAQNTIQYITPSCSTSHIGTVTRTASNTEIINCQNMGTSSEFLLVDINNISLPSGNKFTLPTNMIVHDFAVANEYVFFCGEYEGNGLIGRFHVSLFYQPTGSIEYSTVPGVDVSTFTAIKTFLDPNSQMISAAIVGNNSSNNSRICIINFTSNTWGCTYYDFTGGSQYVFYDITITDSYVVTAGANTSNNYGYFFSIPINNPNTIYCNYTHDTTSFTSNPIIDTLDGDLVAFRTLATNGGITTTRIYTCDINSPFSILNVQDVVNQYVPQSEDLLYIPNDGILLLSQFIAVSNTSYTNSVIISLNPMSNNYNACILYNPHKKNYSLDLINNSEYLIGGTDDYMHSIIIRNNQASLPSTCFYSDNVNVLNGTSTPFNYFSNQTQSTKYKYNNCIVTIYGENIQVDCAD